MNKASDDTFVNDGNKVLLRWWENKKYTSYAVQFAGSVCVAVSSLASLTIQFFMHRVQVQAVRIHA